MLESTLLTTLGDAWCNVMHESATWPIHGHYHCGVCGREYPVLWEQSAPDGVGVAQAGGLRIGRLPARPTPLLQ